MGYVKNRLGRSIDSRVKTAMKLADDIHREQASLLRAGIADIVNEVQQALDEVKRDHEQMMHDLEERTRAAIAIAQGSLGTVSSQLSDTQRRQSDILERLVRRVQALELTSGSSVRSTPPS